MTRPRFRLVVAGLALLAHVMAEAVAQQEASSTAKGVLMGVVRDAGSGAPIPGATVILAPVKGSRCSVRAGDGGTFVFGNLERGRYGLSAEYGGYVRAYFGNRFPGDGAIRAVEITEADRPVSVTVRMWRTATIAGRVTDDAGEPLVGRSVRVLRRSWAGGRPGFNNAAWAAADDRGEYRIAGLVPGEYIVAVQASVSQRLGGLNELTTYYPRSLAAMDAEVLQLSGGEERPGVSISTEVGSVFSLRGRIDGLSASAAPVTVELVSERDAGVPGVVTTTVVSEPPGFGFTFPRVPNGLYRLRFVVFPRHPIPEGGPRPDAVVQNATLTQLFAKPGPDGRMLPYPPRPQGATLLADQSVVIDRDVDDLVVVAREGRSISGRVRVMTQAPPPSGADLHRIAVLVLTGNGADIGSFPVARVEPDGTFETAGLPPGRYTLFFMSGMGAPWASSIRVAGSDVLGAGIELNDRDVTGVDVTLTDRLTAIAGNVTAPATVVVADVSVFVFPADRRYWLDFSAVPQRFRETRVDNAGRYQTWVPPGDYYAIATPTAREFWMESEWLARLSGQAERVTLRDGDTLDRSLRAVVVASGR